MQLVAVGSDGIPVARRSALETSSCGHRYKAIYVDGLNDDSDYSRRGVAFHAIKKCYIKRLAAAKDEMDESEAIAAFEEGIRETVCPPHLVPELRDLWDRHVQHFSLDLEAYIDTEALRVRFDAPVPYQYVPDLEYAHFHENTLEVIDFKTYYVGFTERHARELLQTRMYIWGAMQEHPGFQTYRMTYNFVRLNQFTSVTFDKDDFAMLDREIRAMDAARRARHAANDWTAVPGEVCGFCQLACPVMDDPRRSLLRVKDASDFANVAGGLIVREQTDKAVAKALKQFVALHGPQDVSGEIFDFRTQVERKYPGAAVVDFIRGKGLEPVFTVSASALKTMFKSILGLEEGLGPMEMRKDKPRFGHKSWKTALSEKAGDDEE